MDHEPTSCGNGTYPPLNVLKAVAEDVWIVDGPLIEVGQPWPKLPFPTRMTIMRLEGRGLFIHSPTPLTSALRRQVAAIGEPRWIIGPNRTHFTCIPEWREAYPAAEIHVAPKLREQAKSRIVFATFDMGGDVGYPWDKEISTIEVPGGAMTEFEFFHRASRTLVLTDLIQNFEVAKLDSRLMRFLTRLGGVQHPDGQTPRDLRLAFSRYQMEVRRAIETMIAANPARIILAHGRCYDTDAVTELRRAFRWVLE